MALDTDDKRRAVVNIGSPWRGMLPLPDGSVNEGDRVQLLFLSRDPLPTGSVATASLGPLIGVNRLVGA